MVDRIWQADRRTATDQEEALSTATAVAHEKPATSGKSPAQPDLKHIAVGLIVPSKTNPRRRQTPEQDAELLEYLYETGEASFLKRAAHYVNPKTIRRQVEAAMKAEAKKTK
jgi:hypothetical protein